jgi:hypothetical protein
LAPFCFIRLLRADFSPLNRLACAPIFYVESPKMMSRARKAHPSVRKNASPRALIDPTLHSQTTHTHVVHAIQTTRQVGRSKAGLEERAAAAHVGPSVDRSIDRSIIG